MRTAEGNRVVGITPKREAERGSAIVICLFVLALITVFVAVALTRSSTEAMAVGNETADSRTFYAAQGSLEMMTRNFNKIFETKLNPTVADLNSIRTAGVPGLANYTFAQELDMTSARQNIVLNGGPYSGLYAIRDNWRLRTTTTDQNGVQVQLTRNVLNSRIPIFQFGVFYDDDLELFRPPLFSFGGRVHTNGNFFISPGDDGVYFDSKVTATHEIITQTWRNWYTGDSGNNKTYIKNASGSFKQLLPTNGSVHNTTSGASNNIFASNPDMPPSKVNPSFKTNAAIFDGNLEAGAPKLRLPLKVGYPTDLVEMVKRGKSIGDLFKNSLGVLAPVTAADADDDILRTERYANKFGIRVSLADSKAKLPGCASGIGTAAITGVCGVRLDGDSAGGGADPTSDARGYQPKPMKLSPSDTTWGYRGTRLNGERFYIGGQVPGREVWIKVELVSIDQATQTTIAKDVTQDFLSLGITDEASSALNIDGYTGTREYSNNGTPSSPSGNLTSASPQSALTYPDSRAIIKLQRFEIPGPAIPGGSNALTSWGSGSAATNAVARFGFTGLSGSATNQMNQRRTLIANGCPTSGTPRCTNSDADYGLDGDAYRENVAHLKLATVNSGYAAIVPIPIKMFDTREGEYYDERSTTYYNNLSRVTRNGVMTMVDIDIANLRRFLRGDFNGLFPTDTPLATAKGGIGLMSGDVPSREGWIFYVSDRRGDADFDGELDMEDILSPAPGNTSTMQVGEDVNNDGLLNTSYGVETEKYNTNTSAPDLAAVQDHKYYRRGVRAINASTVPGIYDSATPANTMGFSFSSENGIYIRGNYDATGLTTPPSTGNSPYSNYLPQGGGTNGWLHIPTSVVGDAVTILSNAWNDAESFTYPYDETRRVASETTIRFAMIAGDTVASKELSINQGGISPNLNGGVHNFKRFLETWVNQSTSVRQRLNYAGSLINLFNSRNNNGSFKCCNTVYEPPVRNWVFDSAFLDPARLPPGTPFFQYVQTTGFQRTND